MRDLIKRITGWVARESRLARQRLIGLASVIAVVGLSVAGLGAPSATAAPDPTSDLSNYLVSFTLTDSSSNVVFSVDANGVTNCPSCDPYPHVTAGDDYMMSFNFSDTTTSFFAPDSTTGKLTYQVPPGVNIQDFPDPTNITDPDHGNAVVATFTIVNNVITVTPLDIGGAFWTDYNARFSITAHGTFSSTGSSTPEKVTIDFGSLVQPDITVTPAAGNIDVSKYAYLPGSSDPNRTLLSGNTTLKSSLISNWDPTRHMAHFAFVVTADTDGGPVVISELQDQANYANEDALNLVDDTVKITYVPATGSNRVLGSSEYTIRPTGWGWGFFIDFPADSMVLNPGDRLLVDYWMQIDDEYLSSVLNDYTASYSGNAWDCVAVEAVDQASGNGVDPTYHASWANPTCSDAGNWQASGTVISKTVDSSAATIPGYIAWTATVGDGYYPLIASTISDTLGYGTNGARFDPAYPVSADVYTTVYDANGVGSLLKLSTDTFIPTSSGAGSPLSAPDTCSYFAGTTVIGGGCDDSSIRWRRIDSTYATGIIYSAPGNLLRGGDTPEITQVVFKYYTKAATAGDGNPTGASTNTTCLQTETGNPGDIYVCASAGQNNSNWEISKQGSLQTDATGAYMLYTVKAKVPAAFYGENLTLDDRIGTDENSNVSPMYYSNNTGTGAPIMDLSKLLGQDALSVNVYAIPSMDTDINVDTNSLSAAPGFSTAKPTVSCGASAARIPSTCITSAGSWNVMPTSWVQSIPWSVSGAYTNNQWTMTFGSSSVSPANWTAGSYDTSASTWPVNVDSLLVVTYRVYFSVNSGPSSTNTLLFDSSSGTWDDNFNYLGKQIVNMATIHSGDQAKGIQYSFDGLINKGSGPSWIDSPDPNPAPASLGDIGLAINNQFYYYTYGGQYYFPYLVTYRWPTVTDLTAPPVLTDTYDSRLTFNADDPNSYVYVALHYQPIQNATYSWWPYPATFDLLIKVPANLVGGTGHTLSIDFNDLTSCPTYLYRRSANISDSITYDTANGSTTLLGTYTSPANAYSALKTLLYADPGVGPALVGLMPSDWYNMNTPLDDWLMSNAGSWADDTSSTNGGLPGYSFYTIDYALTFPGGQIPNGLNKDIVNNLTNHADLSFTTGTGKGHLTRDYTVRFQSSMIGKSIQTTTETSNNGTLVDVNVNLNPYGTRIMPSRPGTVFQAIDTMTSMYFVPNSLTVYQITPPQGLKDIGISGGNRYVVAPTNLPNYKTTALQCPMTALSDDQMADLQNNYIGPGYAIPTGEDYTFDYTFTYYDDVHGLFGDPGLVYMYLPDGGQFEIDYRAVIDATNGQTVDLANEVEVSGTAYDFTATKNEIKIQEASGEGESSHDTMILDKVDSFNTSATLGDGVFALYAPMSRLHPDEPPDSITVGGTEYTVIDDPSLPPGATSTPGTLNIPSTMTIRGTTYYFLQYQITDDNGQATFTHPLLLPALELPYGMVEIMAPPGYAQMSEPAVFALDGEHLSDVIQLYPGNELTLTNDAEGGPRLPDTGGPGNSGLFTIGFLLIITSGAALLLTRRRVWSR